jgi:hypothetical protein
LKPPSLTFPACRASYRPWSGGRSIAGPLALAGCILAVTVYCGVLQRTFYKHNFPFYDSLSYQTHLFKTIVAVRTHGLWSGLPSALKHSTVALPWLQASLLALAVPPSRMLGLLIQAVWLAIFCFSLYHYFRLKNLPIVLALAFTLPFLTPQCMFMFNGGLSDFRMDLLQYLLLSTGSVFLLATYESERNIYSVLSGLFYGLSCLTRATSIVYIALILTLLWLHRLVTSGDKLKLVKHIGCVVLPLLAVSVWFYILNARWLYHYYVVWNPDANARLPIELSAQHFAFVAGDAGSWWLAFIPGCGAWALCLNGLNRPRARLNLHCLWIGLVPAGFLTLRGCGLNPYVSMASLFGLCLFCLMPVDAFHRAGRRSGWLCLMAAMICAVATAIPGLANHRAGFGPGGRRGLTNIESAILTDMQATGRTRARIGMVHLHYLCPGALENSLLFDRGFALDDRGLISADKMRITFDQLVYDNEVTFAGFPGQTTAERLENIVGRCLKDDYLILPTQAAAEFLCSHVGHVLCNRNCSFVRAAILRRADCVKVSECITASPGEELIVYRVNHRTTETRGSSSPEGLGL